MARPWPDPADPTVWLLEVGAPALVVGSTQSSFSVDTAAAADAGVEVARRNSGGGAVLVRPGEVAWVDVFLPPGDPLWDDDVGRASHWLGETWVAALADVGVEAWWHDGPLVPLLWSHLVCFAGFGPGEVFVGSRKVVGISQRRTRAGARFQCAALLRWDPGALVPLLALDAGMQRELADQLEETAAGLEVDGAELERAFLARLAER